MVPAQIIELGAQALDAVTRSAATGGPLVRCQLLASRFYEALRDELRVTPSTDSLQANTPGRGRGPMLPWLTPEHQSRRVAARTHDRG